MGNIFISEVTFGDIVRFEIGASHAAVDRDDNFKTISFVATDGRKLMCETEDMMEENRLTDTFYFNGGYYYVLPRRPAREGHHYYCRSAIVWCNELLHKLGLPLTREAVDALFVDLLGVKKEFAEFYIDAPDGTDVANAKPIKTDDRCEKLRREVKGWAEKEYEKNQQREKDHIKAGKPITDSFEEGLGIEYQQISSKEDQLLGQIDHLEALFTDSKETEAREKLQWINEEIKVLLDE